MTDDPYRELGVDRDATLEQIRAAYRRRAKEFHPDLNPGKKDAEDRFKRVSVAYDLLGDPDKRARFDRGEIDASGTETPTRSFYRDFRGGEHPYASHAGFADLLDDELLAEILRASRSGGTAGRGGNVRYQLPLEFLEAVNGTTKDVVLSDGTKVELTIPAGIEEGQVLVVASGGVPAPGGGRAGDALFEVRIKPHSVFRRENDRFLMDVPISLREAVMGARIEVPTPSGRVLLTIPKGANSGQVMRLRGKGVPRPDGSRGDLHATLRLVLPTGDPDLEAFVTGWQKGATENVRAHWSR
jgi:DnaJ-class molecular chaperone